MAFLLAACLAPALSPRSGQAAEDPRRFAEVQEWTLTYAFDSDDPYQFEDKDHPGTFVNRSVYREGHSGTIFLRKSGSRRFKGTGPVSCSLEWKKETRAGGWVWFEEARGSATSTASAELAIDLRTGTYDLYVRPGQITVSKHTTVRDQFGPRNEANLQLPMGMTVLPFPNTRNAPALPASGMVISGSFTQQERHAQSGIGLDAARRNTLKAGPGLGTGRWTLTPGALPEIELVVLPQDYETWRPQAGDRESAAGNRIRIDARLQSPDGGPAALMARTIAFELSGTSSEPGIAMNFPLAKGAEDLDLEFVYEQNSSSTSALPTGEDGQRAETTPGEHTKASATVASHDWGGWATLKVTAELTDGRQITGHLTSRDGATEIPLPKRAKGSRIADSWKADRGVSLPDDDDSEPGPGSNQHRGDGFTLYEEYRGFIANGAHVAGDPKRLDFFVRDYIGVDARPGIDLFANITGAEIHTPLRDTEFDRKSRVMNANHRQGPHLVDQHGVFVETKPGFDGAVTVLSESGVRGRPAITLGIYAQPRDSMTSVTTSENVPLSDLAFAYDRAIAHELLHAVGAEHHGSGDRKIGVEYVFWDDPDNHSGKSHFRHIALSGGGKEVAILDEATGRDRAKLVEGDLMLLRETLRPLLYASQIYLTRDPEYRRGDETAQQAAERSTLALLRLFALSFTWYLGGEHGQCSGDDACVMRYSFAQLYPKKGREDTYYHIGKSRSERAGLELCRSPAGTGVNDRSRKPQPRYGDAKAGCGSCDASIVFNDAVPLEPEP